MSIRVLLLGEMMAIDSASFRIQLKLAEIIATKGFQVDFVYPSSIARLNIKKEYRSPNLRTIETAGILPKSLRRGGFGLLDLMYKTFLSIKGKYHIIHATCAHRPAQLIPAIAGKLFAKSIIIDEWWEWYGSEGRAESRHGFIEKLIAEYDKFFEIRTKYYFNAVIAISSFLKDRINDHKKVYVLNGGAEIDKIARFDKIEARKKLSLPIKIFLIGLINIAETEHDDIFPFLQAFEQLSQKYEHIKIFVTGEPAYIRKHLKKNSISNNVIYKGWLDYQKYILYLNSCDVFVLPLNDTPKNRGRWPHKVGDYICVGRPIITNPTGDLKKIFTNYRLGLLTENSRASYFQLFEKIMKGEIDLESKCQDSKYVAYNILSIKKRIENIMNLYRDCIS